MEQQAEERDHLGSALPQLYSPHRVDRVFGRDSRCRDKLVEIDAERRHQHTEETEQRSSVGGVHIFLQPNYAGVSL
jgi:hypothetical protein